LIFSVAIHLFNIYFFHFILIQTLKEGKWKKQDIVKLIVCLLHDKTNLLYDKKKNKRKIEPIIRKKKKITLVMYTCEFSGWPVAYRYWKALN